MSEEDYVEPTAEELAVEEQAIAQAISQETPWCDDCQSYHPNTTPCVGELTGSILQQPDLFAEFVSRKEVTREVVFKENTPFEVWENYTRGIFEIGRRTMRDAGECLIFGERKYGEKCYQVVDAMRYDPKTLSNAVWVVKNVKEWHDNLSFAHHSVIAALPAAAQEDMLAKAEAEGLTVAALKKAVKEAIPPAPEKAKKDGAKKAEVKAKTEPTAPRIDLTDESQVLQSAHLVIAFLEQAEAKQPFRQWPEERMKKWAGILGTFRKIHRRTGLVK